MKHILKICIFFILNIHYIFSQTFTPSSLSGLSLWLSADSVLLNGGNVSQWYDKSGNNMSALQAAGISMPSYVAQVSSINDKPVLRFDGINDFLNIAGNLNIGSAFFVANWNDGNTFNEYNMLFSQADCSSPCYLFCGDPGTSSLYISPNATFDNVANIFINGINNSIDFAPMNKYKILSGVDFSPTPYNDPVIGCYTNMRYWNGDIAEIILYSNPLTTIQRDSVISYLRYKYAPPVNLGPDINIAYGFCPQTIHAGSRFKKFQWFKNGSLLPNDTLESISINTSGNYTVSATDIFGFISNDSINVTYPITNLNLANTTICSGDSIILRPQLSDFNNYAFSWSNNASTSQIYATTQGDYWVQISDTACGVKISDTITITIDPFASMVSLGNDTSICSGNTISITSPLNYPTSLYFLWKNGTIDSLFTVSLSDTIWVQVSNNIGCMGSDTIIVTVIGTAPQTNFIADTVCFGDSTLFTNTTIGTVDSWLWKFGDGDSSFLQTPKHLYQSAGTYLVKLIANQNLCSKTIQKNIVVKTVPSADFTTQEACISFPIQFIDNSTSNTPDSISSWDWNFGDTYSSNDTNPNHTFTTSGTYIVLLTITSSNACTDTLSKSIIIIDSAPLPNAAELFNPTDNSIIGSGNISFLWGNSVGANHYKLIVSSSQNFTDTIYAINSELNSITINSSIFNTSILYWKILSYNICNNFISSSTYKFSLFNQSSLSGLSLWLSSDSVLLYGGNVSQWYDKSGNNMSALQAAGISMPSYVAQVSSINDKPVLRFDGINDFLNIAGNMNIGSAFFVVNWNDGNTFSEYNMLFSKTDCSSPCYLFCGDPGTSSLYISPNATFDNLANIFINSINNSIDFAPMDKYKILSGVDFSPTPYNDPVIGCYTNMRYWNGDIAEIILYSNPLTTIQRDSVISYLRYKYAPPVNLGSNINITYGFCDTTIHAGQRFTNFQWTRNGVTNPSDTSEKISINQSGTYKVTVTDIFGFQSSDSINVTFPNFTQLSDTIICFGDTLNWNLNLNGHYNYQWNDNDTNSIRNITLENTYQVTITDTTAHQCSLVTQPVFVKVDSFPNFVTLGPDTTMCTGNTLYLQNGYNEAISYLWSNGNTDNNYIVSAQDTISPIYVSVTDSMGCIAKDTLNITGISGIAPTANFNFQGICFGDTTYFTDASNGSVINSWLWNFSNQGASEDSSSHFIFNNPGTYPVKLIIKTQDGCSNSIIKDIEIHHLPAPEFISKNNCTNNFTNFINQTAIVSDSIISYNWSFGDNTISSIINPIHSYPQEGDYITKLIATSNFGCIDTIEKIISIKTAPLTDFTYSPVCKGQPVYFADNTQNPVWYPINFRKWDFGDATTSSTTNPTHTYNNLGSYIIKYITKSSNGCSDTAIKILIVTQPPEAAFTGLDACVNNNHQLLDSSISTTPLSQWKWKINSIGNFTEQNPVIVFTDTLQYNTELIVISQSGCSDTISQIINVHNNPHSGFTLIPEVAAPLQTISFNNTTTGASQYLWDFGDGQTSSFTEPVHTFADSGLYNVSLLSTNTFGCRDSSFSTIRIIVPQYDIAVLEVSSTTTGNFIRVNTKIANFGSLPVDSVSLFLDMGNGVMIKEALNYHLLAGEIINYTFTSQLNITPQNTPSYICVDALPSATITDFAPANNHLCKALAEDFEVLPPYPSPVGNYIYIEFIIPTEGNVTISLYNALGQKMKTLFNQHANAGFNRYVYLAGEITKGSYYYQVEYNGKLKTQNFVKY